MSKYITARTVADLVGWTEEYGPKVGRQKAVRWLRLEGAAIFRAGRWVTTREMLKSTFPEVYDELMAEEVSGDD